MTELTESEGESMFAEKAGKAANRATQFVMADGPQSELDDKVQRLSELESEIKRLERQSLEIYVKRLKERRRRLSAEGKLRRLKARKWWRLAGVLGRWRRAPLRLDRLFVELWHLLRDRTPLPSMPDLRGLDHKLEIAADPGRVLTDAKEKIAAGDYEGALEALDLVPIEGPSGLKGRLLARDAYIKMGELSLALAALRDAISIRSDRALTSQARVLEGRLLETETWWLPDPGPLTARPTPKSGRILHVVKESLPYFERGYTMRSHTSFLAQIEAGYEPIVATSLNFPRDDGISGFPPVDVVDGISYHRLDLGAEYVSNTVPYDIRLSDHAAMVLRLAEEVHPAVIQAGSGYRGYETALVGMAVARKLDLPFIYEIRSFLEHTWTGELSRSERGEYYKRRFAQEVRCLKEADHVITIADAMKDEIVQRGISSERVTVVPNVVNAERFIPRPKNEALIRRYGLTGRKVLGYISNLGQREGITTLIEAVAMLRGTGLDAAGLVVGEGPEVPALLDAIQRFGLAEYFTLTGHVPNQSIEDYYSLIDVFVVPRIDDRAARMVTPLKPLEAMAMGIPVVVSNLPALVELVEPGVRGLVFESGNPQSLAEVVTTLLDSGEVSDRLRHNARDWVMSERTVSSNAVRFDKVLSLLTA